MSGQDSPRGVRPDGPKIRTLRKRAGFTQRDFADRFSITARTLQRAEGGERILPEMLNSIAAGLKVASSELSLESGHGIQGTASSEPTRELVRLPRATTARQVVAALAPVQHLAFDYDIDPDEKTAEEVAAAIEIIERLSGEPESRSSEPSVYVRQLGQLNKLLGRLEEKGVRFFIGGYWEPTVIMEDESAPDRPTQYCRVETISRGIILIAQANVRYLTRSINRKYTDAQFEANLEELRSFGWEVEDRRNQS
jgi:transcriptional regulator with XRE-family HTH domain